VGNRNAVARVPVADGHRLFVGGLTKMIALNGSVVGVDVGCSPSRRSSAICRLDWLNSTISWQIRRFKAAEPERERVIAEIAGGRQITAAAFDGPIRRDFDIIGRYRTAERMLTRRLQPLIGKPGQSSAPVGKLLNQHANECVRHLSAHSRVEGARHGVPIDLQAIVEAFPSSFLGMMIEDPVRLAARRGDRSDTFFEHLASVGVLQALAEHCLPGRRLTLNPGSFVAVGDDDGWIILPPRRFIQSTQWELLSLNASEEAERSLHVEVSPGSMGCG
jgi:hypothetical protein